MIIAIDGFSSTGKSTLAKDLASSLCLAYVDTGAMYRAVTLYMIKNDIPLDDENQIANMLEKIDIEFRSIDGKNTTFLDGENVENEIRGREVSDLVSPVSTIPIIREKLVFLQQKMGETSIGLVMDGRDIGTVVFPNANFKFFITSDKNVRALRRYHELIGKGYFTTLEEVKDNLEKRDSIDTTRSHSPLRKAEDAIVIDNTNLTKEEQLNLLIDHIKKGKS